MTLPPAIGQGLLKSGRCSCTDHRKTATEVLSSS
jgi:hypothetical protein